MHRRILYPLQGACHAPESSGHVPQTGFKRGIEKGTVKPLTSFGGKEDAYADTGELITATKCATALIEKEAGFCSLPALEEMELARIVQNAAG